MRGDIPWDIGWSWLEILQDIRAEASAVIQGWLYRSLFTYIIDVCTTDWYRIVARILLYDTRLKRSRPKLET